MAQTTGAVSSLNVAFEISLTGTSAWTDVTGEVTTITPGGGERASGDAFTFTGDYAVITIGKKAPIEITVNSLYTEESGDNLDELWTYYDGGTPLYVRYCPKGTANWKFTSTSGYITGLVLPSSEAGSGDPLAVEWTFRAGEFAKS